MVKKASMLVSRELFCVLVFVTWYMGNLEPRQFELFKRGVGFRLANMFSAEVKKVWTPVDHKTNTVKMRRRYFSSFTSKVTS